jgi:hypothetical protein
MGNGQWAMGNEFRIFHAARRLRFRKQRTLLAAFDIFGLFAMAWRLQELSMEDPHGEIFSRTAGLAEGDGSC